jgi:hypothetical protein
MLRAVNFLEGFCPARHVCIRVIRDVYEVGLGFADYVMTFEEAKGFPLELPERELSARD